MMWQGRFVAGEFVTGFSDVEETSSAAAPVHAFRNVGLRGSLGVLVFRVPLM